MRQIMLLPHILLYDRLFCIHGIRTLLPHSLMVYSLGGECHFGDHVLCILEIAVEGVVFGRNINTIFPSYTVPIVLNMQAVYLQGEAVNSVIRIIISAFKDKVVLCIVGNFRRAEVLELIASGHREHVNLVREEILFALDLCGHLLSFPLEPIGDLGELGLASFA